jgi:hypothetical protein
VFIHDGELRTRLLPAHGLVSDGQEGDQREYNNFGTNAHFEFFKRAKQRQGITLDYPVDR